MSSNPTYPVSIPYEGTQELVLDSASQDGDGWESLLWLHETSDNLPFDESLERVCRSAVILKQANPDKTFDQCLDTAVIWERG